MNIFVLDEQIELAAAYHCDKHVVKQVLESTQMLSTAVQVCGGSSLPELYRPTHANHPCSIWARLSRSNFLWLYEFTIALANEYTFRYGKVHKSLAVANICHHHQAVIPSGDRTPFALAMPNEYKSNDAVKSYRRYYLGEKRGIATWRRRQPPEWWIFEEEKQ